jgi:hypothetical protein
MGNMMRILHASLGLTLCLSMVSCGGGHSGSIATGVSPSSPTPSNNVAAVIVDFGPSPSEPSLNTLFTTVTICAPGSTTNCQIIDHIEVDTASFGLRILAPVLTLSLPVQTAIGGGSLLECTAFGDGYSWGPVALVDFTIAGETAASMPIQLIGDSRFPTVPSSCSSQGPVAEDTVLAFGANGIIGIGVVATDCPGCSQDATLDVYYACASPTNCSSTAVPLANQVPNPIAKFATDNNGSIIQLPSVPDAGAATVTGTLTFGVDTQSNNQSGTPTVAFVDPNTAELTMIFNGQTLNDSFIDSGTNGIYFNDANLPTCTDQTSFYCPTSTQTLPISIQKQSAGTVAETFDVVNADTLTTGISAFPGLAGTTPIGANSFDWGLSFFYGRRVATVLSGKSTSVANGPYIAF